MDVRALSVVIILAGCAGSPPIENEPGSSIAPSEDPIVTGEAAPLRSLDEIAVPVAYGQMSMSEDADNLTWSLNGTGPQVARLKVEAAGPTTCTLSVSIALRLHDVQPYFILYYGSLYTYVGPRDYVVHIDGSSVWVPHQAIHQDQWLRVNQTVHVGTSGRQITLVANDVAGPGVDPGLRGAYVPDQATMAWRMECDGPLSIASMFVGPEATLVDLTRIAAVQADPLPDAALGALLSRQITAPRGEMAIEGKGIFAARAVATTPSGAQEVWLAPRLGYDHRWTGGPGDYGVSVDYVAPSKPWLIGWVAGTR